MSTRFPHFAFPTKSGGVGSRFAGEKLSPAIPAGLALSGTRFRQKNFYPTYPRITVRFPPGYPRNLPHLDSAVENLVEKGWNTLKKPAQ